MTGETTEEWTGTEKETEATTTIAAAAMTDSAEHGTSATQTAHTADAHHALAHLHAAPLAPTHPPETGWDRDRDRQVVPFGERSLREEKQKEKTPAEVAEEQKQAKLQQIDALLHKLHATQTQHTTTTHTTTHTTEHKEEPATTTPTTTTTPTVANEVKEQQEESEESVEAQLMALMGLPVKGFDSTKGKEVKDGNVSGVKVATQRKFRQVMKNNKGQPTRLQHPAPHTRHTRTSGGKRAPAAASSTLMLSLAAHVCAVCVSSGCIQSTGGSSSRMRQHRCITQHVSTQ